MNTQLDIHVNSIKIEMPEDLGDNQGYIQNLTITTEDDGELRVCLFVYDFNFLKPVYEKPSEYDVPG